MITGLVCQNSLGSISLAAIEKTQTLPHYVAHCSNHFWQEFIGRDLIWMSLQHMLKAVAPKRGAIRY
jgi:hypothetical protein